jgi:asparagine synthase (glutamine-hydrolysing)
LSGFVCILHRDGAPIERALLESFIEFLSYCGPDGLGIWAYGPVGLGHALLRTTHESKDERQPTSLASRYWIVADARLDAREELLADLERAERRVSPNAPDCELILQAYTAWGTSCIDRLRGDFSFAIWDAGRKQLFCARDHFGVKPLYYACIGALVVLSNTLNCIRQHPAVSSRLNDLAIADFLLFDMIREPGATSFASIQRVPPAHTLTCDAEGVSLRRYWVLPVSGPVHYPRANECVEQFRKLLDRAVTDRLRTDSVGVLMSGGLDSPTVTASARRMLARKGTNSGLYAYTEIFKTLIPDEEGRYARAVAEALQIPIEFQVSDETRPWKHLSRTNIRWPEPFHSPLSDGGVEQLRRVGVLNRVALTGFGGDPTLSCLLSKHFSGLLENRQVGRALADAKRYFTAEGRFSRLYLRTRWQRWFGSKSQAPQYPAWLNQSLEKRLGLRERWETFMRAPAANGFARRTAYEAMTDPFWPNLFEGYDAGVTGVPLEVRHPFFDLRLVRFLLALPALPWCSDKELLREAARGILPDAVRLRCKSPLLTDPLVALLQRPESVWVDSFEAVPELGRFVERRLIPKVFREKDPWTAWTHLRPLSLNFWLRSQAAAG